MEDYALNKDFRSFQNFGSLVLFQMLHRAEGVKAPKSNVLRYTRLQNLAPSTWGSIRYCATYLPYRYNADLRHDRIRRWCGR